jgi:hypothetical protein
LFAFGDGPSPFLSRSRVGCRDDEGHGIQSRFSLNSRNGCILG